MKKFAILLNGELNLTARLEKQIKGARVVAADGGMRHAKLLGVKPECWIGDFDSSDEELLTQWSDVQRLTFPAKKDKTDGGLAVDYALENGADEIILVAGIGGRLDQSISHMMQLIALAEKKINCFATNGREEAWSLLEGFTRLDLPTETVLSVVGFTDLQNLSLTGVEWVLDGVDVCKGATLTISNQVTGPVSINIGKGYGVVIANITT